MELGMFQKQTMKLAMTQQLQQAITILQYSSLELKDFIYEQALENPLIELEEASDDDYVDISSSFDSGSYETSSRTMNHDYDPFAFINDESQNNRTSDLLQQARYLKLPAAMYKRLEYMILLLDDDGYLPENIVGDTAVELRRPAAEIEHLLSILQKLDPPGVGARNLKECLLLQIKQFAPENELAQAIIARFLPWVAEKNWQALAKEHSVSVADVCEAVALIQKLQPSPGAVYKTDAPTFIRPDVTIEQQKNDYVILLHDHFIPAIHYNHQYDSFFSKATPQETSRYVHNKYKQMMWLIKSIEQRRITLTRVVEAIVRKQRKFLARGPHFLAPLTLKEVADELDIHESTVSRAVRNKSVQTPQGLYELEAFFTSKVHTASGQALSSTSVKLFIKDMIEHEANDKPLSDQKIVETLKTAQGITLSRRTVAKYREQLRIPSSSKRRKYVT